MTALLLTLWSLLVLGVGYTIGRYAGMAHATSLIVAAFHRAGHLDLCQHIIRHHLRRTR